MARNAHKKMVKTFPVPCTKEEIDKLLEASAGNDFYYTLFLTASKTGRRISEYYDVKAKDIDFENKTMLTWILKRRQKIQKEAILTDDLARHLKAYILRNKFKLDDYIFRKVSKRQINFQIKVYAKKAGIKHNVSFHNFRHYFITALLKQGWTYDKVARLTGHSKPESIVSYDHSVASDIKEEALKALEHI